MNLSITPPFGALVDVPLPSATPAGRAGRAVVIGGSMGGLLAARALADHFDQVIVLDRDSLPAAVEQRKGVPQGQHVHAMLGRGCQALNHLFPDIVRQMVEAGAMAGDAMGASAWYQDGGWHASGRVGFEAVVASRPLIENVVRRRVASLPNVDVRGLVAVRGLLWSDTGTRITGVSCSRVGESALTEVSADLVVDATGRGSQLPAWLERAGFDQPPEQAIEIGVHYVSRRFRRRAGEFNGAHVTIIAATPGNLRGGPVFAIEGDQWLITLSGCNGTTPPTDLDGFRAYAAALPDPVIARFLEQAEPIEGPSTYAMPHSERRFATLAEDFPEGILPFADAICGFNPVFGQGMTVAALEAEILGHCLAAGRDDLVHRFMASAAPAIDGAWKLATSNDLRFVTSPNPLPRQLRFIHWYLDQLHVAAQRDREVAAAFARVVHMMQTPQSLLQPRIVRRVMLARVRPHFPVNPSTRGVPAGYRRTRFGFASSTSQDG